MPNAAYLQDETCSFMMYITSSNVLGRWVRVSRKDGKGGVMLGTEWQGFHSGIEALVFLCLYKQSLAEYCDHSKLVNE